MRKPSIIGGLVIAIGLALLAMGACTTAATPTPTLAPGPTPGVGVPTATPASAPAPDAGAPVVDRLRVAVHLERETNDPHMTSIVQHVQLHPMYEAMIRFDEEGHYVPMLATEWEVSPDMKTWTFNLRQGVQFHKDFGEFTASDVVHTIQRHAREESVSTDAVRLHRDHVLPNVEIVDDYKIVYRLPLPSLEIEMTESNRRWGHILSQAHFEAQGQAGVERSPVGTGPYQYVERAGGSHILFERVPYEHWRITPQFREVQIFFVKEPSTRLAMLLSGEAHLVQLPPDLERTAIGRGMEMIPSRIGTVPLYTMFGGNFYSDQTVGRRQGTRPNLPYSDVFHPVTEVPWVHPKVREALNRAVDRQELQATLLGGKGDPMPVSFYHPSLPGWNPEWSERFDEKYGYDPERARELLREVEEEIGQPLDWSRVVYVITPRVELPVLEDVGEAIWNYWRAIGVNARLEQREFIDLLDCCILPGSMGGVAWTDATIRFEDPDILGTIYYSGRDLPNRCCHFFERDQIDSVFERLVPETDLAIRDQLHREAGEYIFEEYATLPLVWLTTDFTVDPRVVADFPTSGVSGLRDLEYVVAVRE